MTRRKAYLVSMVQTSPDAPPEFTSHYEAYWRAVNEHVASLEMRAGPVARVFVEGVGFGGEEGLLRVQQADRQAHRLVQSRLDSGAVLEPYEDQDLFEQVVDWGRILQLGFVSQTVAGTARDAFEISWRETPGTCQTAPRRIHHGERGGADNRLFRRGRSVAGGGRAIHRFTA